MSAGEIQYPAPITKAQKIAAVVIVLLFAAVVGIGGWYLRPHREGAGGAMEMGQGKVSGGAIAPVEVGGVTVNFAGELRASPSELKIEFKNGQGQPVDVGNVKLSLDMNMSGMPMHDVAHVSGHGGHYTVKLDPPMRGDWVAKISFRGPEGAVEKSFPVKVH